jgi:hypothetical protein
MLSKRGDQWVNFAAKVLSHVEHYTVPQYGDEGEDLATNYTVEDCNKAIEKYLKRSGKNQREGQDQLDYIKIAHYAQMAYRILQDDTNPI